MEGQIMNSIKNFSIWKIFDWVHYVFEFFRRFLNSKLHNEFADFRIPQSVKLILKCYSKVNQMPDF